MPNEYETIICPSCDDVHSRLTPALIGEMHTDRLDRFCRECYTNYAEDVRRSAPLYVDGYLPSDGLLDQYDEDEDDYRELQKMVMEYRDSPSEIKANQKKCVLVDWMNINFNYNSDEKVNPKRHYSDWGEFRTKVIKKRNYKKYLSWTYKKKKSFHKKKLKKFAGMDEKTKAESIYIGGKLFYYRAAIDWFVWTEEQQCEDCKNKREKQI